MSLLLHFEDLSDSNPLTHFGPENGGAAGTLGGECGASYQTELRTELIQGRQYGSGGCEILNEVHSDPARKLRQTIRKHDWNALFETSGWFRTSPEMVLELI